MSKKFTKLPESVHLHNRLCPYCGKPVNALDEEDQISTGSLYIVHSHFWCFENELHNGDVYDPKWEDMELLKKCEIGKQEYNRSKKR